MRSSLGLVSLRVSATPPLPVWVPPVGQFANISLNTMSAVDPCPGNNCVYSEVTGQESVFNTWNGAAYAPQYSQYGAMLFHGGGHSAYAGNEVYAFDLTTRLWVRHKNPSLFAESAHDSNGEYPDGQPFPPHTYDGVQYLSPANGGGAKGSFLRFGFAAASTTGWCHKMDLSATPSADSWSRYIQLQGDLGGGYTASAFDTLRSRYWLLSALNSWGNNGFGYVTPGSPPTLTMLPNQGDNTDIDHTLSYCPLHDMLVHFSFTASAKRISGRLCTGSSGFGTLNTTAIPSGAVPQAGLVWSTILNCFVHYPGNLSTTVYKLTPPASNPLTNQWVWSSETLTGVSGAVPSKAGGAFNGTWSRFQEVPALKSFVFADGRSQPVQLWRLAAMV